MLARLAGRSARRAEKQRRFALVVFGGPQITAERQVTLKQRLQIIERCAAGVVAERAGEVSRGALAGGNDRIVWNPFVLGRPQPVQVRNDALELLGREAVPDALRHRRPQLNPNEDALAALQDPNLGVDDPVRKDLADDRYAEQQSRRAGRAVEEGAPPADRARWVILEDG